MSKINMMEEIDIDLELSSIDRINLEHKIFLSIIKKIDKHLQLGSSKDYIDSLIYEFKSFASFHFISEENIMTDIKYPNLKNHKNEHDQLLSKLQLLLLQVEMGTYDILDLPIFLVNWIKEHTVVEDKKIIDLIHSDDLA